MSIPTTSTSDDTAEWDMRQLQLCTSDDEQDQTVTMTRRELRELRAQARSQES